MNVAELKEMWREENWERKVNGIPRIKWADFKNRTWIVECPSEDDIVKHVQKTGRYIEEMNGYTVRWNGELVTGCSPRDLVDQIMEGENSA
jgi:hypothetical protein